MLSLSAIRHFVRITLFIASTPPEAELSMCLTLIRWRLQQLRSGGIMQNIKRGCGHASKEKYYHSVPQIRPLLQS